MPAKSTILLATTTALLIAASARAQANPPPWWKVSDLSTLSLSFTFANPPSPGTNVFNPDPGAVTPPWHTSSTVTFDLANQTWLPNLTNHTGVLASTTANASTIDIHIDNDPRPNWIKIFWIEYEEFESAPRQVNAEIAASGAYLRHNVRETVVAIGNGWNRVTLEGELRPQPDDEDIPFEFEMGAGTLALDNVHVCTRCIPLGNEAPEGEALGQATGFFKNVTATTNNPEARGTCYTDFAGQEIFWVSATGLVGGQPHELFGFDANNGNLLFALPQFTNVSGQSPTGLLDLAAVREAGGMLVYGGLVDQFGNVQLQAFDVNSQTWMPGQFVNVLGLPAGTQPRGLAYNPDGLQGQGTFWIHDQLGNAFEVDRFGNLLRTFPTGAVDVHGAGYDPIRGELYWFGRAGTTNPIPVQTVGSITSVVDMLPTGNRFFGIQGLSGPGVPQGGLALGMDNFRRPNLQSRMVCLADLGDRDVLYEMHATFRYGFGCNGDISMANTEPFLGNGAFTVQLTGVPDGQLAFLYAGFSKSFHPLFGPLPLSLGLFGLPECAVVSSLDESVGSTLMASGVGASVVPLPLAPPLLGLPVYWQWAIFGPLNDKGISVSPGGKTVLY